MQTAESYWNRLKTKFKQMKGVSERQLALHLDEFMWREVGNLGLGRVG